MILDMLMQLRRFDRGRAGVPGEHLFAAVSGVGMIRSALRSRSTLGRALGLGAGLVMLYRAASGRDGIARLVGARKPVAVSSRDVLP